MKRRILAMVLALVIVMGLTACAGGTRSGQVLDTGWKMRGDADKTGEQNGWQNGFDQGNETEADTVWYANTFAASLVKGDRVILSLCDLGQEAAVWLNGEPLDERTADGEYWLDVTDTVKRVGNNTLVIRAGRDAAVARTALAVRPSVMVADVSIEVKDEVLYAGITLDNAKNKEDVVLTAVLTALDSGKVMARVTQQVSADEGTGMHTLSLTADDVAYWSVDHPYLYDLTVMASSSKPSQNWVDTVSRRVGFADQAPDTLRILDLPQAIMRQEEQMRAFINQAKNSGITALNPNGQPTQALLSYADAVGMLVIAEHSDYACAVSLDISQIPTVGEGLPFAGAVAAAMADARPMVRVTFVEE